MMATESPKDDRSNEAALTSNPELVSLTSPPISVALVGCIAADSCRALCCRTIDIANDPRHVGADRFQLNGDTASTATDELENKHISEIVDDLVNSAEVSTSGGSDNEAAKSDMSKLKDGEKGHGRSSSTVKKPASFKSISVNRTFLTTKGASTTPPLKVSDKATPTTSLQVPGSCRCECRPPETCCQNRQRIGCKVLCRPKWR